MNIHKSLLIITFAVLFQFTCTFSHAQSLVAPADVKNMHMLQITHLFMPVESTSVIQDGLNCISTGLVLTNTNYMFDENGKKGNFDVETTSLLLTYTRKISNTIEARAMLPFYYNSGGFMDCVIEGFHATLPIKVRNGGREFVADNEIHIWYQKYSGGPDINSSFYGIGDPSFFIKKIFQCNDFTFAGSLGIKPWTGSSVFINSNTTDLGVTLNAEYAARIMNFFTMAGFTYFAGEGIYKKELEQERDWMILFAFGAGIRIGESVYAVLQFYCNTSPYVTGVKRMDNISVLNSYAIRWRTCEDLIFQFSFDEDTFTYVTTDIAFSLRCAYSF